MRAAACSEDPEATKVEVTFQPGQSHTPIQQTMCVTGVDFVIRFWKSLQFLHAE